MRFLLSAMAAVFFSVASAQAADPADAKNFVDGVSKQVLEVVKGDGSQQDKQHQLEGIFSDKVDIQFIAKFVLAKHWREITPAQQQAYLAAYKPFILKNYASKLAKYTGQTFTLKDARPDGDASIVTMVIHDTDGKDIDVDYRLQGGQGSYKIVDIMVEGVSLLQTQRSEFDSIVQSKGIDYLTDRLKTQAASKG